MATILASWELGRGYGHLSALAPAARALAAFGHRTVLVAREPATAERLPDRPFAQVAQAPIYRRRGAPVATLTYATVIGDGGLNDPPSAARLVQHWLDIFAAVKPAGLLTEHAPASLLAAHVAGLPAVRLGMGFTVPPAESPLPSLLPWATTTEAARRGADRVADAVIEHVCRAYGKPAIGLAELLGGAPPMLATWPELDIYGAREGLTYYGPLGGFAGAARPDWPAGEGPRAVVYHSKSHAAAGVLSATLAALGWPTLWHSADPPPVSAANILYSPEPLDMMHALGGASIEITHAAHGSLCDGLRAGVPQFMLPDTLESMLAAARLTRQSLGGFARDVPSVDALSEALRTVADDPRIAAAAAATRARYAAYRPQAAAAELARDVVRAFGI